MRIEPWMKRPVVTIKPQDSALHARETMEKHRINQLPVVTDGDLVGIVTDRDLRDEVSVRVRLGSNLGASSRSPGSSKRWLAPGTIARRFSQRSPSSTTESAAMWTAADETRSFLVR